MDSQSQIVGFAFKNNISEKVLQLLPLEKKYYLKSDMTEIRTAVKQLASEPGSCILGLGMYSGRDQEALRIETVCKNKFRNAVIDLNGESQLYLSNFINSSDYSKYVAGMGNSWCNLVSYLILSDSDFIEKEFSFIHIPRTFSVETATHEITIGCLL